MCLLYLVGAGVGVWHATTVCFYLNLSGLLSNLCRAVLVVHTVHIDVHIAVHIRKGIHGQCIPVYHSRFLNRQMCVWATVDFDIAQSGR